MIAHGYASMNSGQNKVATQLSDAPARPGRRDRSAHRHDQRQRRQHRPGARLPSEHGRDDARPGHARADAADRPGRDRQLADPGHADLDRFDGQRRSRGLRRLPKWHRRSRPSSPASPYVDSGVVANTSLRVPGAGVRRGRQPLGLEQPGDGDHSGRAASCAPDHVRRRIARREPGHVARRSAPSGAAVGDVLVASVDIGGIQAITAADRVDARSASPPMPRACR